MQLTAISCGFINVSTGAENASLSNHPELIIARCANAVFTGWTITAFGSTIVLGKNFVWDMVLFAQSFNKFQFFHRFGRYYNHHPFVLCLFYGTVTISFAILIHLIQIYKIFFGDMQVNRTD